MVVPSKSVKTLQTPITVEQWGEMEGPPHYDLVDGKLRDRPGEELWHEILRAHLLEYFGRHVHQHKMGVVVGSKAKLKISKHDGRGPDLYYIPKALYPFVGKNLFKGVPSLVIEILSPSSAQEDRGEKCDAYAQLGIEQYWIVDFPQRCIEVYALRQADGAASYDLIETVKGDAVFRPAMFPGLEIPLADVWPTEFENRTDE